MKEILKTLDAGAEGLLFLSESESPLTPFYWENPEKEALTAEKVRVLAERTPTDNIVEVQLHQFFEPMTVILDEYGEREKAVARKFENLILLLEANLKNCTVYRTGRRQIDCYIVGEDSDGNWAGLKTRLIET